MNKLLGIDYGSKRIGIAISDDEGKVAFPKAVLSNNKKLFENLEKVIKNSPTQAGKKFCGIVLGESLNYRGEKNEIMKEIEKFKIKLEEKFNLPVYFEQEFMTSMQAQKSRNQENKKVYPVAQPKAGGTGAKKQKKEIDDSAAAIILQSYLDKNQT
ncbi:Holliday junction resolvase RuvX [Patescibacteria group bacterium]|nr:Holliday junction resolvase RuvX [Patescibacteria group bacterium]MBU4057548.1 Holliday junction resolvase RuvX [Patescibacteria group bacterium]MBU4115872.1 Holliday junction resolvase RuvX [Patescibacteria group bacterium]